MWHTSQGLRADSHHGSRQQNNKNLRFASATYDQFSRRNYQNRYQETYVRFIKSMSNSQTKTSQKRHQEAKQLAIIIIIITTN